MVLGELGLSLVRQGGDVHNRLPLFPALERVVGEFEGAAHRRADDGPVAI